MDLALITYIGGYAIKLNQINPKKDTKQGQCLSRVQLL